MKEPQADRFPRSGLTSIHVRSARDGEKESLQWIVSRFTPFLLAQAEYRLRGSSRRLYDPEDLVHETWAVALPRLEDLRAREGRLTPVLMRFLSVTLLNKINNVLTRQARAARIEGPRLGGGVDGIPSAGGPGDGSTGAGAPIFGGTRLDGGPDVLDRVPAAVTTCISRLARDEVARTLRDALDRLSEQEREILILRGIEQIPNELLARRLDLKPGAVSMRYRRALDRLRSTLPRSLFDELSLP